MKCKEIIQELEKRYPKQYAVEWDNVGLLVGDEEKEVNTVFCALDLTDETLSEALDAGADLIVTHHPMLFRPVGRIVRQDFIGRRIISLIENGISYFAMHTNFDIAGMADRNASDLGLIDPKVLECVTEDEEGQPQGFGRVGEISEELSLKEFAANVKSVYGLDQIRVYGDPEKTVKVAAVSSGSGKSSLDDAIRNGADVLITGDVDYHTAIDAVMKGISVIDAGHYGTEFCFIEEASKFISETFPELKVICAGVRQPYHIF
ncbi:MAG: Nif3-like dinuclear metal center hexameric protein [Lachnospiraceae bacterium]|nr:Nif3-like dinuclear metal center hexameric protein [Lachnospiraceae bacterium]